MGVITKVGEGRRGRRSHNPRFYDEGPRVREERTGWPRRRRRRVLGSGWAGGGVHEQGGGER